MTNLNLQPGASNRKDFCIKEEGPELTEKVVGKHEWLKRVKDLGFRTVPRLLEGMNANGPGFGKFLGLSPAEFSNLQKSLAGAAGFAAMSTATRARLTALKCSLGALETKNAASAQPATGDTGGGAGAPPPFLPNIAGCDLWELMQPVRNQGDRGTCVAHAVVRCREALYASGSPVKSIDLSEQLLYWVAKQNDGIPNSEGTFIHVAAQMMIDGGTCPEFDGPYVPTRYPADPAQAGPQPCQAAFTLAKQHRPTAASELASRDVRSLCNKLFAQRAIAYSIPVYKSWYDSHQVRKDGILTLPIDYDALVGYHAITLTGFGIDPAQPGGGYFIFDNSWGVQWAEESHHAPGRGTLPFRYAHDLGGEAFHLD